MSSGENLTLEVKIISAEDIRYVNIVTSMDVYAVVSIIGDKTLEKQEAKTPVDRSGHINPKWNHTVKFSVNESLAHQVYLALSVKLVSQRLNGDRDIGEVSVPLWELMYPNPSLPSSNGDGHEMKTVTCPLRVMAGTKGTLNFSYRFDPPPQTSGGPSHIAPPQPQPEKKKKKNKNEDAKLNGAEVVGGVLANLGNIALAFTS